MDGNIINWRNLLGRGGLAKKIIFKVINTDRNDWMNLNWLKIRFFGYLFCRIKWFIIFVSTNIVE